MKRREAIQQIAVASVAMALWPGCDTEVVPSYTKIPLDRKAWKLFQQFAEAIVPVDHEIYKTLEPRANYILKILNDCTAPSEVATFNTGLQRFGAYIGKNYGGSIETNSEADLNNLFEHLQEIKEEDPDMSNFYLMTRNLAKQHFTTSEKYMTEQLEYKFIPGPIYLGCVNL